MTSLPQDSTYNNSFIKGNRAVIIRTEKKECKLGVSMYQRYSDLPSCLLALLVISGCMSDESMITHQLSGDSHNEGMLNVGIGLERQQELEEFALQWLEDRN